MRILIDARCLQSPPPRSGVGAYAERIIRELLAIDRTNDYLLFANGIGGFRRYLPTFDTPNARWTIGIVPNKVLNPAYGLRLTAYGWPHADVIFLPNLNFIPRIPLRTKLIVTVHDLSFEHFPDCFTWKQRLWHRMIRPRALLARADAIVAVSETTKRDVIETYGISEGKMHVVYPGIDHRVILRESETTEESHDVPRMGSFTALRFVQDDTNVCFILTLSAIEPRKNIDGLIAAFERLTAPMHLVIAGIPGSASRAIHRQIARSPARDRIHLLGPIPEDEKRALLALSSCFVYPSLWEGFGFPPLEAMAVGVPVVASTGGALPEVLGNAALLIDPLDPSAIADAITRVHTDAALRADLRARGHARAAQFRWDTAARQVLDCIMMGSPKD